MAYISKLQSGGALYDIAPPPDLTDTEKAEYRSRIGAISSESSGAPVRIDISLPATAWSGGTMTLTSADYPALSNIASNSLVQFFAADESAQSAIQNNVKLTSQGAGSVTFSCSTAPSGAVNGLLVIFN